MASRREIVYRALIEDGDVLNRVISSRELFEDTWFACVRYVTINRRPVMLRMAKELPDAMLITVAGPGVISAIFIGELLDEIRS